MALLLVGLPAAFAEPAGPSTAADRCPDLRHVAGLGLVCPRAHGLYEVFSSDGRSMGLTHGMDQGCSGCPEPMMSAAASRTTHCVDGLPDEHYVHVLYARAKDDTDRYATMLPTIRDLVASANAMVDDAAIYSGDRLSIRTLCANGELVVDNAVLDITMSETDFATIVDNLTKMGYNDFRQKYWVYFDDAGACPCAGVGHIYFDETGSVDNLNNAKPGESVPMFAVIFDQQGVRAMLHELGHTLGAVQDGAPTSTLAGHCIDGRDIMCYNDGGPRGSLFSTNVCPIEVFDCGGNTYCNAYPSPGSYLATRWQACSRVSRFLEYPVNVAPLMQSVECSPSPSFPEENVTCTFVASDEAPGLHYWIDWGDGVTERVPSSGEVKSGITQTRGHIYTRQAEVTITVNATDIGYPPLTSDPLGVAQSVLAPNDIPSVAGLTCDPVEPRESDVLTCTFSSTDLNNVWYGLEWGDGSAAQRIPASGFAAGSDVQTITHVFSRGGLYSLNISATDDGRPAKAGPVHTMILDVAEVNTAPVMRAPIQCPTRQPKPGDSVTCKFSATDDSPGLRYTIEWGDGTTSIVPGTGHATPGATVEATHAYSSPGTWTVRVSASDINDPPLTSAPVTYSLAVKTEWAAPTVTFVHPQQGTLYRGCAGRLPTGVGRAIFLEEGCVRVDVNDASGVAMVLVLLDNTVVAADVSAPFELVFPVEDTGELSLSVRAFDRLGNSAVVPFKVDGIHLV